MKKNWQIIVLMVWFGLATWNGLDELWAPNSLPHYIFKNNGVSFLTYVFGVPTVVLHGATLNYFFKPAKIGFYTGIAAIIVSLIQGFVTVWFVTSNFDGVKQAYIERRQGQGLSVRPEFINSVLTPEFMIGLTVFFVLIYAVISFLLIRNRKYFDSYPGEQAT